METKRRRIRFHRKLSLAIALFFSVVLAILLLRESGFIPYQVSKFINEHYLKGTPFHFSCDGISGDLVHHITLERPVLRYAEGGRAFSLFRAERVKVDYRLFQVLKLRLVVDELVLENVRLQVERDAEGRLIMPLPVTAGSAAGEAVSPSVDVRRFAIDGLQMYFSGGERRLAAKNVSLSGSFGFSEGQGTLEIESGSGFVIESGTPIRSLRARAGFRGDEVNIEDFLIRLDNSFVMATGGFESGALRRLQLIFNPVDLKEISDLGLLPMNRGEMGGNLVFEGPLDSLTLEGSLTGSGWGFAFSGLSFEGTLTGRSLSFSRLQGDVFGCRVDGELEYAFGERGGCTFRGNCSGLDLSQGFLPGGSVPETDLYGYAEVDYRRSEAIYTFRADMDSAVVSGFESGQLRMRGRWHDARGLEIEEIEMLRPGFVITGSGIIDRDSRADMIFELEGDKPDYLWDFFSLPRIGGSVALKGRIVGPMGKLQINLNGDLRNATFLFAHVDSGAVQAQINDVPSDAFSARVDVKGHKISLGGRDFSNPHILLTATPQEIRFGDFSFSKGDTFITMDLHVRSDSARSSIEFKHFSLVAPEETWNAAHPIDLVVTERGASLDSLTLSSSKGSVGLSGNYSTEAGTCRFSGWGRNIDLSLFRDALGLPARFQGRAWFQASVEGDVASPQVDLSCSLQKGEIDSLSFDRLDFEGAFSEGAYHVHRLVVSLGEDTLSASGWWRFPKSPVRLIKEGIEREEAFGSPIALHVRASNFPLAAWLRALHAGARPKGAFSGDLFLEKTLRDPRIRVSGGLSGAEELGIHLPVIELSLEYEDSVLILHRIAFRDGNTEGMLDGKLPVVFDASRGLRFRQDASLQLGASITSRDLNVLSKYFDRIAAASGHLSGKVTVGGSANHPVFGGQMDFRDCAVRLSGMEEVYTQIEARVDFVDSLIQLASVDGREGKRGSFYGSGYVEMAGFKPREYRLDLYFEDFLLASIPDFQSTQKGNIAVSSYGMESGELIPYITGSVEIKQAQIAHSLGAGQNGITAAPMPTASPGWLCDIDVEAPKNVWIRNPELNMELGGHVILKHDERGFYLRGELEVLRGWYTIYNNKFRITDGTFDFSKTNSLRPELYISAYTPYRREGGREHRIFLSLSWPSDKKAPLASLSYDEPGYSETDIWKMLGGTYVSPASGAGGGESWDATGAAHGIATNYLERVLNAQMTDVTIDVETRAPRRGSFAADGDREMSIAIGKYLSEDLYLKYRQGLSITSEREVDIEYRISNMFLIRSEIIRHSGKLFLGQKEQVTDEINLDIRFRFEY